MYEITDSKRNTQKKSNKKQERKQEETTTTATKTTTNKIQMYLTYVAYTHVCIYFIRDDTLLALEYV